MEEAGDFDEAESVLRKMDASTPKTRKLVDMLHERITKLRRREGRSERSGNTEKNRRKRERKRRR